MAKQTIYCSKCSTGYVYYEKNVWSYCRVCGTDMQTGEPSGESPIEVIPLKKKIK